MNCEEFLADADVDGFLDFFSGCLNHLEVDYLTHFRRIRPPDRRFHVIGFAAALGKYAWPAEDTFPYPPQPIYDWPSTERFLQAARAALNGAIGAANVAAAWAEVGRILVWGVGARSTPKTLRSLRMLFPGAPGQALCGYITRTKAALTLATTDTRTINPALIRYASSGMVKVHSLASDDGLVIFDSRVAATLGECINEYLRRSGRTAIPMPLRLMVQRDGRGQRTPLPLASGDNHPVFVQSYRWIDCQVRASWLLEAALTRSPALFPNLPMPQRMHRLEAACFMMGAYLKPGPFAGRSFNFAGCP